MFEGVEGFSVESYANIAHLWQDLYYLPEASLKGMKDHHGFQNPHFLNPLSR